jgi:tRNA(Ile)-lysidine synthase
MLKKILDYVKKYHMIEDGDTIVAGISGGADSVCLLFVLLEFMKEIPFSLEVVHVNHGIRPEAGKDAEFVKNICNEKGLPFHLIEEDIKQRAKESGRSEEEEGREVRYSAFDKILGRRQGKIAVAHNSNDRAETGAGGIPPVNHRIIRPLLCVERCEIEYWLSERNLKFCIDCTNEQDIYTRNRIRHHILNYAEEYVCSGAVANMNRAAEQLREAEEYLARQTLEAVERCKVSGDERKVVLSLSALFKEDEYMQSRVLYHCLCLLAGSKKDLAASHIAGMKELFFKQGNGQINLPYHLKVYKNYDLGMIQREDLLTEENRVSDEYEILLPPMGEALCLKVPGLGSVEIRAFYREDSQIIPQKTYTKWFDYDKITKSVMLRTKHTGYYLTINQSMGRKSLQDYFVNEKIPRQERQQIYLLAEKSHIIWVLGHRISEYYKVTENTDKVLQVKILENITKEERSHSNG